MKKQLLLLVALVVGAFTAKAQDLPMPSQFSRVEQTVGLTEMAIEYSRPNKKDREIFGKLVPYNEIWRLGANMATTIEFSSATNFQGVEVEAGKYALYAFPSETSWKFVLNTNWNTGGTSGYDEANNVASFTADVVNTKMAIETFTILFSDVVGDNAKLMIMWDNVMVSIDITSDSKGIADKNIEDKLNELNRVYSSYNNIARYYLEQGKNEEALKYALLSVESAEKFWNVKVLSEAYAANGDMKNAIKTAERSLELSKEAEYQPYIDMNNENIKKWSSKKSS